ncbi:hypothetical protein AB0M64_05010 [Streptomyces sp. NPDC051771]|uniref:hypothetical protein n=1 Tax=Streptomyces sp. NPDC051771 TaxID=3154847 RepID=UPI00341B1CA3
MRTALRTALAAALVAGVAATPVLAAGSAFAAGTTPAPTASATATAPATTPAKAAAKATEKTAATAAPAASPEPTSSSAPAETPRGTYVRTDRFPDGTSVKVYKLGAVWHRAEISGLTTGIGSLETGNRPAALDDNGSIFVLTNEGEVHHWNGGRTVRAAHGFYRLANGTVLEFGRHPQDGRPGIQAIDPATGKGNGFTYLYANNSVYTFGSVLLVVEADRTLAAYDLRSGRPAAPEYLGALFVPTPAATVPASLPAAEVLEGPFVVGECAITQEIRSSYGAGWLLVMTNDPEKGPWAVLKDPQHEVVSRVDRAHPVDGANGLRIDGADTATPRLGQRTQGGDTPYRYNAFPALPKDCDAAAAPVPSAPSPSASAPANSAQGGQTSVVPKGGVAAGVESGAEEGSGALVAAGAGAASLAAAGLGFTVLRRRSAAARG